MQVLTERQNEILRFIAKHIEDTGLSPHPARHLFGFGF